MDCHASLAMTSSAAIHDFESVIARSLGDAAIHGFGGLPPWIATLRSQ
jgi:hypothetical protein